MQNFKTKILVLRN